MQSCAHVYPVPARPVLRAVLRAELNMHGQSSCSKPRCDCCVGRTRRWWCSLLAFGPGSRSSRPDPPKTCDPKSTLCGHRDYRRIIRRVPRGGRRMPTSRIQPTWICTRHSFRAPVAQPSRHRPQGDKILGIAAPIDQRSHGPFCADYFATFSKNVRMRACVRACVCAYVV